MPGTVQAFLALFLCATLAAAAELRVKRVDGSSLSTRDVDAAVLRLMQAAEVTGVALTLFNDGQPVYSKAYGLRDAEKKLPLTADSVMGGASFSKVAFAYLAMQFVAEQRLDLDKPVQQYLPKPLPEYDSYRDLAGDARCARITARMLLSHTAGFPNLRWLTPDRKLRIHFEPGSRYAYSGEGIQLLQLVIETIAGRPLEELMQERVFRPLGMSRTSMLTQARFGDDYANGYDEWGRSLGRQQRQSAAAAGSMQTTLRDFTRFLQAVMSGTGLPAPVRDRMLSPQIEIRSRRQFPTLDPATTDEYRAIRLSYGLGWGLYFTPHGKAFFKEGHDEGFRHYAVVFDGPRHGLIIMTNSSNGEGIFKEVLETILGNRYTPIAWEGYTPYQDLPPRKPLAKRTAIEVAPERLDRLVGRYTVMGAVLKVTRQGRQLLVQENDGAAEPVFAETELRFFSKTADDVLAFELGADGRAARIVVHTGGRTIPAERMP